VKGATLLRLGDTAAIPTAIRLLHRATETDHLLEVPWAHELLGHAYQETGELEAAEHHYRQCMATADEHRNGTTKVTELFLAEVLIQGTTQGPSPKRRAAVVARPDAAPAVELALFRYHVARARLALRQGGDPRAWAAVALELAGDRRPQLPLHPTVGVVDPDPGVITEPRVLVQGCGGGRAPRASTGPCGDPPNDA
jgi:hypothetical protein